VRGGVRWRQVDAAARQLAHTRQVRSRPASRQRCPPAQPALRSRVLAPTWSRPAGGSLHGLPRVQAPKDGRQRRRSASQRHRSGSSGSSSSSSSTPWLRLRRCSGVQQLGQQPFSHAAPERLALASAAAVALPAARTRCATPRRQCRPRLAAACRASAAAPGAAAGRRRRAGSAGGAG
jgi:hypothetical protein